MAESQIIGYRDLSADEIELINAIKAHGAGLDLLFEDIAKYLDNQAAQTAASSSEVERLRLGNSDPYSWAHQAKLSFQNGLMQLARAVAQPTSF